MPHCLVTGGTRGIGAATALLAARRGYDVTLVAREADGVHVAAVAAAVRALGRRVETISADVAKDEHVVRAFDGAEAALGRLDALVNAAGIGHNGRVEALDASALSRLLAVNVLGTMLCCREAARRMSTARGGPGGGIVNVSSMAATIGGRPGAAAYAASKAAVDSFTTGFAREVAAEGIRVNVVRPGVIATDMTAHVTRDPDRLARVEASIPMRRLGHPGEVAEVALWLLSDTASFVTGAHVDAGGGGFSLAALR